MPTIPSYRPLITDAETRNGTVMSAALMRKLMDWLNYTWSYDVRETPSGESRTWFGLFATGAGGLVTGGVVPSASATFHVPAAQSYAERIVVWAYVDGDTVNGRALLVTDDDRKREYRNALSYAAGPRWESIEIPMPSTGGSLSVFTYSGTSIGLNASWPYDFDTIDHLKSVSAWWKPIVSITGGGAVTIDSAWSAISQTFLATDRPAATYVLRWLARRANLFTACRPRMVVNALRVNVQASASYPFPSSETGAGAFEWGRWKTYEAPLSPSSTVWVRAINTDTATRALRLYRNGTLIQTWNVPTGGVWTWLSATLTTGVAGKGGAAEYTLSWAAATGAGPYVFGVSAVSQFENEATATNLALPGGQAVPSWATIERDLILSRQAIRADKDPGGNAVGLAALVKAMIWLWSKRLPRCTMFWSGGVGGLEQVSTPPYPLDGTWETKIANRFVLSPDSTEVARYFDLTLRAVALFPGITDAKDPMKAIVTNIGTTGQVVFDVATTRKTSTAPTYDPILPESLAADGKGCAYSNAVGGYMDVRVQRAASSEGASISYTGVGAIVIAERPRHLGGSVF